jgi:hypothetical protein
MKLDIDFTSLENLVKKMGARTIEWSSDVKITNIEKDWKIILETKGIDVDIKDVDILESGLLKYRGEQILLYIKEINSVSYYSLPKYHFYDCTTLKTMKSKGRLERYVVTQRKTGLFLIDKKVGGDFYERNTEERLEVCKNCLNWYNKNYKKRYSVATFDIIEFFENFLQTPIRLKPIGTDQFPSSFSFDVKKTEKSNFQTRELYSATRDIESINVAPENTKNSTVAQEQYADISPVLSETVLVEVYVDEETKKFEDMF